MVKAQLTGIYGSKLLTQPWVWSVYGICTSLSVVLFTPGGEAWRIHKTTYMKGSTNPIHTSKPWYNLYYSTRQKKSVRKVSNGKELPLKYYAACAKCICSTRVLLLEVHDRAAKRIRVTRTTYQHFCIPMSPLSLYLIASLNSSSFCLASLLCGDHSIAHTIICNIVTWIYITEVLSNYRYLRTI